MPHEYLALPSGSPVPHGAATSVSVTSVTCSSASRGGQRKRWHLRRRHVKAVHSVDRCVWTLAHRVAIVVTIVGFLAVLATLRNYMPEVIRIVHEVDRTSHHLDKYLNALDRIFGGMDVDAVTGSQRDALVGVCRNVVAEHGG